MQFPLRFPCLQSGDLHRQPRRSGRVRFSTSGNELPGWGATRGSAHPGAPRGGMTEYEIHCENCDTRRTYSNPRAFDRAAGQPCEVCMETVRGLWELRRGGKGPAWLPSVLCADTFGQLVHAVCDGDQDAGLARCQERLSDIRQPLYARRMWGHLARYLSARGAR